MKKFRPYVVLVPLAVFFTNCMLLSGRCVYELRNVNAEGSILENGGILVAASVTESEQRDYQPDKDLMWQITGETLKGHVQKITLQEGTTVRYDFPVADASRPALSSGFVRQSEGANLNGFWDLLSDRKGSVVIATDIPSRPSITIQLLNTRSYDWNRPYCS